MAASPLSGVSLNLVESVADAAALMSWLSQRRPDECIAIDTESGGLSPERDALRLVQVGDGRTGWAIPWERWGGVVLEILRAWRGRWITHNGVFDWRFIEHHTGFELPWDRLDDTLTMARLDDPTRANGLKPLSKKLIDRRAVAGQQALDDGMRANGWTWATVPIDYPPYWAYGSLDPVLTTHLHNYFSPVIEETCPEAYSLERSANRLCALMMRSGMLIDVPYVERSVEQFNTSSAEIRSWLKSRHKITSPKSGGQIRRAFENLGQEILFWTDRNAPQFDKDALSFYEKEGQNGAVKQLAKLIRAVRHIEDIRDRYSKKFLELRDSDGVIHCNINVMGARTGRMSVSDPALQQLPRDDKVIRGSFVPRPGHVFITCDLDQVEARLLAALSRDPGLIQAFHEADTTGPDFFTVVARALYRDESIVKDDSRRQLTKNSVYTKAFGGGLERLRITAGVTLEEGAAFEEMFNSRFPGMKKLMGRLEADAKVAIRRGMRGGVRLEDGRFLPCDEGREYATLNYYIQGTAARRMKVFLAHMDAAGLTEFMRLVVHDEIILEVPVDQAEEVLKTVEACMTDRDSYSVPLTAGGSVLTERWQKT